MDVEDIPVGMRLKDATGWNQLAADWELFLEARPHGCFVADQNGTAVGTATTIVYDNTVGWVSMVLVDEKHRRRGVGTELLRTALASLEGNCDTIKLDATPAGRKVYLPLGFRDELTIERRVCTARCTLVVPSISTGTIETMASDDLAAALALDQRAFGVRRDHLLQSLHARASEYALVWRADEEIQAFCCGRHGSRFEQVGPLVSKDRAGAEVLLAHFGRRAAPNAIVLDTPNRDRSWLQFLDAAGFQVERELVRMFRGDKPHSGDGTLQWAVAGPELG